MKIILKIHFLGIFVSLLFMCSCATKSSLGCRLPADVEMNKDAGRGNELIVTLRLESGDELPFVVDTGCPTTLFDKSLEPKLGKRLGAGTFGNFGTKEEMGIYAMPKLYLGNTRLMTGDHTFAVDLKSKSFPGMGVLGMDCLRHYCIQLDFEARKIRFLDPNQINAAEFGKAYPLSFSSEEQNRKEFVRPFIHCGSLIGGEGTNLMIDTGYRVDGALESGLFQREVRKQMFRAEDDVVKSQDKGRVWFPKCVWNNQSYTNLLLGEGGNLIGLGFLARHLVTLDFPKQIIYLKQTSVGPLVDEKTEAAVNFVEDLKERNQLPGWTAEDEGMIYFEAFPNCEVFDGRKKDDLSAYHYKIAQLPDAGPLKLQKAWRTDQGGKTIEEFPVP